MSSTSQAFDPQHPLLAERARLDKIVDIMLAKIQKTLFFGSPPDDREWTLKGTGVGADDVLSEALAGLLRYPPERLEGTWEGLAVTIARNKALDAIKTSRKGLRGTDHRPELSLVSGDAEVEGPDGEMSTGLLELVPGNLGDPEAEYSKLEAALQVRDLAREVLSPQELEVFFDIHFRDYSRKEVGDRLELTSQRISQIYNAALKRLEARIDYPFPSNRDSRGGTSE